MSTVMPLASPLLLESPGSSMVLTMRLKGNLIEADRVVQKKSTPNKPNTQTTFISSAKKLKKFGLGTERGLRCKYICFYKHIKLSEGIYTISTPFLETE